jgi:hypothetical protein
MFVDSNLIENFFFLLSHSIVIPYSGLYFAYLVSLFSYKIIYAHYEHLKTTCYVLIDL